MELPRRIEALTEVDEKYKEAYKEHDGGYFVLQLKGDDADAESKLKTFRDSNIELLQQQKEMVKQLDTLKGIDPKEHKKGQEALAKLSKIGEKQLIDEGKLDEVVESRVGAMRDDFKAQLEAKEDALKKATEESLTFRTELSSVKRNDVIRQALDGVGKVRSGAMIDVLHRAEKTFVVDDSSTLVAQDSKGSALFDTDGNKLTPQTWAQSLITEAPYLFEGGGGGGAEGGKKGKAGIGTKYVDRDPQVIGKHLKDIASGKVEVAE